MFKTETKELKMNNEFRKKIKMICKFIRFRPTYKNSNARNIKGTNIVYAKHHIIIINKTDSLVFDDCYDIYINGYNNKIKFKD